ncbi:MAG: Trk system potassium transporter TrkA [Clostridia bacterium]|nr:Trk system potassium transporter TrkA [Clostridia bacterium]
MNIIIVGCGRVGQTLAAQLNEEGNNITVVDVSADSVNELTVRHDIMGVVGNGATHTVQQEAGIDRADLLIAVTGSDELNMLCCLIAKKEGDCQTVARIQNPVYSAEAPYLKDELGLAMVINPEYATAREIARVLRFPSAIKIETFAKGRVELLKFRLPEGSRLIGMSVKDVVAKLHCDILVCTVERDDEAYIAKGDFVFEEKDIISIIASPKNASDFFKKIDYKSHSVKSVMIAGGGETTHYLCDILQKSGISVKVIESDLDTCEEIADKWRDVAVIHSDTSDKEILLEEGIDRVGAFVALTEVDEENILLSLYAKSVGDAKLITRINRVDYDDVIRHLDLDTTVYPESITADMILRYVRAMKNTVGSNVETLYNVIKGKVEASEFIVKENSPITDTPLSQLRFKDNVLIAAILRGKTVIIPRGHDVIKTGDAVVIVSGVMALHDICDVLR